MTFVAVSKFKNVCGNLIHGYFGPFHAEVVFGLWPDFFIKIHSNMMHRCFCVLQFKHCLFVVRSEVRALCVHMSFFLAQLELSQKSQTFLKHYWLDVLIGHAYVKMHERRKTLDNIHIDGHFWAWFHALWPYAFLTWNNCKFPVHTPDTWPAHEPTFCGL